MAFQEIVFEVAGPVANILHNRPHTRNAENKSLLEEMDQALQAAVGIVGDQAIDLEVDQGSHLVGLVYRPGDHLEAERMGFFRNSSTRFSTG